MPATFTCGEALVRILEAYGVEVIFGIPGVHTVELYRGLPATRIRHITPRHEQGAGFMADGYARVSGKPGVCFIVTGPGMTNIATAMGQAYADSVPMLVISAVNARPELGMGQGRLHELPSQRALVSGVAAFSHTLLDVSQLPEVLARAFAIFTSARPRPVHIEIPLDVIVSDAGGIDLTARALPQRPEANDGQLAQAAALLTAAKRPLIIVGGGAVDSGTAIRDIAERLGAPVFLTINGRGLLPPGHPLLLKGNLSFAALQTALGESDCVLALGTEFGETEMYPEARPVVCGGKLIRVDIDPTQLMIGPRADLAIQGDAAQAAQALARLLGKARPRPDGAERAARINAGVEAALWPAAATHRGLARAIEAALPGAIIAGDQTEPVYALNQFHQLSQTRSYFNSSTGYGTLGYGLPAAFGAKLAAPSRPVVCLIGDGGLQFSLSEIAAACEAEIPVAIVVWNNRSYGEIKAYMADRGIPQIGVDIHTPDFAAAARALGAFAAVPESRAELVAALRAAMDRKGPTLIEIRDPSPLSTALTEAGDA